MNEADVELDRLYRARVRGRVTIVHLASRNFRGGWTGYDIATGEPVRITSPRRLLCRCDHNGRAIETADVARPP